MYDDELMSSFVFAQEGTQQRFYHQWQLAGQLHECPTCSSSIDADEPPSQHWLRDGEEVQVSRLSKQQQAVLDIIEARQIETFFFCDESAKDELQHFLDEICNLAMPELLNWMFHNGTQRIEFNVACYVNVGDQLLIFQSGNLNVQHHYDIEQCINCVYEMLTQRIENYLGGSYELSLDECSITRLRVQVKRIREDPALSQSLPLQLQHEIDTDCGSKTSEARLLSLRTAYVKYQRECPGYFPSNMRVNLYGLQQCRTTKEVYVVPYHISETLQPEPNKNFLILNDIMGKFQRLHELPNPLSCSSSSGVRSLQCRRCRIQFKCPTRLYIHQQLRCGHDFSVDSLHPDIVEVYEQCLPISRSVSQYACYGITKPKTVMRKGQFVPIECDWRSKSSVQVQNGPCVIISNSQLSSPCKNM